MMADEYCAALASGQGVDDLLLRMPRAEHLLAVLTRAVDEIERHVCGASLETLSEYELIV